MNLENYEKADDIEIKEPADIYRAILDGCVAEFHSSMRQLFYSFNGEAFVCGEATPMYATQNQIDMGYWTLWRKKPKPKWWELASPEKPVICKQKPTGAFYLYMGMYDDWDLFEPLTDAEIDQLKCGYEAP